jgi:cell division protein FtsI (penicillin-binding protein 3)
MRIGRPSLRLVSLFVAFAGSFAVVAARLVWVQGLASSRYQTLAADQRLRKIVLPSHRGSVFDRNGAELAISLDMKTIFANPHFVPDAKAAAAALAPVLGTDAAALASKLSENSGFVYLARKVDPKVAGAVAALGIPGIESISEPKRFYPSGRIASHVVGFSGTDNVGLAGIESAYDKLLAGSPGSLVVERDPQGTSIPVGRYQRVAPVSGDDVVLTIDREIQYATESSLAAAVDSYHAQGGSIVVMRPQTGEVLALANWPDFDPNDAASAPAEARKNRAVIDVYEPGSANKVITAAAALESGVVKPSDVIAVPDSLKVATKVFHDAHGHGVENLSFTDIIQQSSNVGTIKVAMSLGKDRLYSYLQKFGYGKPTGLGFPGEAPGILPQVSKWWNTSLPTMAIGQGVAVTPMQIMSVYATVANGGVAVRPRLVEATVDSSGRRHPAQPSPPRRVILPQTANTLTRILLGVTESKLGTGRLAAVDGYQVAGKTGTAQKPRTDAPGYSGYVSSFIGFAPAAQPQLLVGVVLDNPTPIWGGYSAAPTFHDVMQFALRHLGIGPGPVLPLEGTPLPAPARSGDASSPAAPVGTDTAE